MTVYTKAEQISDDLSARLATIRVAAGYETDIGATSFKGRVHITAEAVPCNSIVEGDDNPAKGNGLTNVQVFQDYALVGYAVCDPANPNDTAHKIIRDIKRAVFKDGATLGGKVRSLAYQGRNIGPRADGVAIVSAVVHVTVEFAEDLTNP